MSTFARAKRGGIQPIIVPNQNTVAFQQRTIFVDALYGNDGTGLPDDPTKPFLTIPAAVAASSSGDKLAIAPGTYAQAFNPTHDLYVEGVGAEGITGFDFSAGQLTGQVGKFLFGERSVKIWADSLATNNGTCLIIATDAIHTLPGLSADSRGFVIAGAGHYKLPSRLNLDTDYVTLEGEGELAWSKNWERSPSGGTGVDDRPTAVPNTVIEGAVGQRIFDVAGDFVHIGKVSLIPDAASGNSIHAINYIGTNSADGFHLYDIYAEYIQSSFSLVFSTDASSSSLGVRNCWFGPHPSASASFGVTGTTIGGTWVDTYVQTWAATTFSGTFRNGVFGFGGTFGLSIMSGVISNAYTGAGMSTISGYIENLVKKISTGFGGTTMSGLVRDSYFQGPNVGNNANISGTLIDCEVNSYALAFGAFQASGLIDGGVFNGTPNIFENASILAGTARRTLFDYMPGSTFGSFGASRNSRNDMTFIDCTIVNGMATTSTGHLGTFGGEMRGGSFGGNIALLDGAALRNVHFTGKAAHGSSLNIPAISPPMISSIFGPSWVLSVPVAGTYRIVQAGFGVLSEYFDIGDTVEVENLFALINGDHTLTAADNDTKTYEFAVVGAALVTLPAIIRAEIIANELQLEFAAAHGINTGNQGITVAGLAFVTTDPNASYVPFSLTSFSATELRAALVGPNEVFGFGAETIQITYYGTPAQMSRTNITAIVSNPHFSQAQAGRNELNALIHKRLTLQSADVGQTSEDNPQVSVSSDTIINRGHRHINVDTTAGDVDLTTLRPAMQQKVVIRKTAAGNTLNINDHTGALFKALTGLNETVILESDGTTLFVY